MADDIDTALHSLACEPLPAALAGLGDRVMARIDSDAAARLSQPSFGVGAGIAAMALVIGISTARAPVRPDAAPLQLSVFSANAALTPAALLATGQ